MAYAGGLPQRAVAYTLVVPIFDNDGDLVTSAAGLTAIVSKDAGGFSLATGTVTEIMYGAVHTGMYKLALTATEMDADSVEVVISTTTADAKDTPTVINTYTKESDIVVDNTVIGSATYVRKRFMTLLDIRRHFIEKSGRYDLASSSTTDTLNLNDTDSGADFYIQSACRQLDLEQETLVSDTWFEQTLVSGEYSITLSGVRYINGVYYVNSDGEETKLEYKAYDDLIYDYPTLGSEDTGTVSYYTIVPVVRPGTQRGLGGWDTETKIILMPPTDSSITVKITGRFYSEFLWNNDDTNYWTINYPEVLIIAALRELEIYNRNTEGVNDFTRMITPKLQGIDKDLAAYEAADSLEMEG